jgi:hypothetical protein
MLRLGALVVAGLLLFGGCSDDDGSADDAQVPTTVTSSDRSGTTATTVVAGYAVLSGDDWRLVEAHDPPADDPVANRDRPPLDWYAEYDRGDPQAPVRVRVSGHSARLGVAARELEAVGFRFEPGRALVGVGTSGEEPGPSVVLVARGDRTVMLLSYELDPDELEAVTADLVDVDSEGWLASGGTIA